MGTGKREGIHAAGALPVERYIRDLPELSASDRDSLEAALMALRTRKGNTAVMQTVHSAMRRELRDRGFRCLGLTALKRSRSLWPQFRVGAQELYSYMEDKLEPRSQEEACGYLILLLQIIISHVPDYRSQDLQTELILEMPNVAEHVDRAFPGYAGSGLLPGIVRGGLT